MYAPISNLQDLFGGASLSVGDKFSIGFHFYKVAAIRPRINQVEYTNISEEEFNGN